jgi:hypothetical protein
MTQDGQRRTRKPLLVNLAWAAIALLGLATVYVLSFAPAKRWYLPQASLSPMSDANDYEAMYQQLYGETGDDAEPAIPFYRPVDWLIDETPARGPLLWWERLCGVDRH